METSLATDLRWLLLGVGVLLVVGIYYYTLWDDKRHHTKIEHRKEPDIRASAEHTIKPETEPADDPQLQSDEPVVADSVEPTDTSSPTVEQKIIVLHIQAQPERPLLGSQVLQWSQDEGLVRSGDKESGFFISQDASFYVTNILQPGTFKWAQIDTAKVGGLSFFAQLPVMTLTAPQVFENMRQCAVRFAEKFGSAVLDDHRRTLTVEAQRQLEQELQDYQVHCEQAAKVGH